jgi:hypothetical protein
MWLPPTLKQNEGNTHENKHIDKMDQLSVTSKKRNEINSEILKTSIA